MKHSVEIIDNAPKENGKYDEKEQYTVHKNYKVVFFLLSVLADSGEA